MILFVFLLITYFIFILFSLIISLFGGIFTFIFQKKSNEKWNLNFLEYFFISYGIGIIIFIQWSYILNIFKLFNFFSIIIPFLASALIFLLYLLKKIKIQEIWIQIKKNLSINHKNFAIYILILSSIYFFQFLLFWSKVSNTLALSAFNDTHRWIKSVVFLIKYGFVNFPEQAIIYPWGFNFFLGGNALLSPDFITKYFFIKLAGLPFLHFYTLGLFCISKRFLKNPLLIFFCLITIFSDTNFLLRTILFLSSTISLLLILISFMILLTKIPHYLLGFTIPGIFLINPIYAFYFIIALIIFYLTKIITSYKNIKSILKELFGIIFLSIIFLIVYFISFFIFWKQDIFAFIKEFFWVFQSNSINKANSLVNVKNCELILLLNASNFLLSNTSFFNLVELMWYFFNMIILYGFSIMSIFLSDKKLNEKYKEFIMFMKIGLILTLFFLTTPLFFEKNLFTDQFYVRVSETFFPCLILLSGFFLETLLTNFNKKSKNFKKLDPNLKGINKFNQFCV